MKNYSFGDPKNFVDDLPDDWFAKRPTLLNSATETTNNVAIGSRKSLMPYLVGGLVGLVVGLLVNSKK